MSVEDLRKRLVELVGEECVKKIESEFRGKDMKEVLTWALKYIEGLRVSAPGAVPACDVVIEYVRGMLEIE